MELAFEILVNLQEDLSFMFRVLCAALDLDSSMLIDV